MTVTMYRVARMCLKWLSETGPFFMKSIININSAYSVSHSKMIFGICFVRHLLY